VYRITDAMRAYLAGPATAAAYPNRVDVEGSTHEVDAEGGDVEVPFTRATGLACSVQPVTAREAETLKARGVAGTDVARFPRHPGIAQDDVVTWTDAQPPAKYRAVRCYDEGGLGLVWCVLLDYHG
jgi:hypothetical protein